MIINANTYHYQFKAINSIIKSLRITYLLYAFPSWGISSVYNVDTGFGDVDQLGNSGFHDIDMKDFDEQIAWKSFYNLQ